MKQKTKEYSHRAHTTARMQEVEQYLDAYMDIGGRVMHDYRDIGGRVTPGAVTEEAKAEQLSREHRVIPVFLLSVYSMADHYLSK
jgi:hypothetical protein